MITYKKFSGEINGVYKIFFVKETFLPISDSYRYERVTKEEYMSSPAGKAELVKIRFSQNKPLPL
jgi:hypothetical protein